MGLGLDLITSLGFTFLDSCGASQRFFRSAYHGSHGGLKSFFKAWAASQPSQINLHMDAHPYSHAAPIATLLCHCVIITADLTKLFEADIIETVNTSLWISNLVIAKKYCSQVTCMSIADPLQGDGRGWNPRQIPTAHCRRTHQPVSQFQGIFQTRFLKIFQIRSQSPIST